eukprot:SAG31_NODE_5658_length_2401_cov_1.434405_3_plen_61_part_00
MVTDMRWSAAVHKHTRQCVDDAHGLLKVGVSSCSALVILEPARPHFGSAVYLHKYRRGDG